MPHNESEDDDYYFFSSALVFPIVCVLHFSRKEHEFTWGLLHRWCVASIRDSQGANNHSTLTPHRPLTRHKFFSSSIAFSPRFAFLSFRKIFEVIARAEKNFRFLIFVRSENAASLNAKRRENKSSFREVSPWGHRSFRSRRSFDRNEIVNIAVGVARAHGTSFDGVVEFKNNGNHHKKFSEEMGRWTRNVCRWRNVESKRSEMNEVLLILPESSCWSLNRRPMCLERISDETLSMMIQSRTIDRCDSESNCSLQLFLRFQLRSMMNLNCSGDPF